MNFDYLNDGAAECPMIRIYGSDPRHFLELFNNVQKLATGTSDEVCLNELEDFKSTGKLVLTLSTADDIGKVGIFDSEGRFEWRLLMEMWGVVAGLVEPFLAGNHGPYHQWLMGREARYGLEMSSVSVLLTNNECGRW